MKRYNVGAPLERVALDVLGPLPESESSNKYIMVVADYFSKWTEAYAIPNQEAVAKRVVDEFVSRFGVPRQLHSDQGRNFISAVFTKMCALLGINKTRTTALHPQSDGMVERYNKTLESMLAKFTSEHQRDWDEHLPLLMMAYRTSIHETTGCTPSMMMLGREAEVPLDLVMGSPQPTEDVADASEYTQRLRQRMETVHNFAREHLNHQTERQKRYYDHRGVHHNSFNRGDPVWLHNPKRKKGRCPKLQNDVYEGPFLVIDRLDDLTYRIQKAPKAKAKVVHHNRLKPYEGDNVPDWLVSKNSEDEEAKETKTPAERKESETVQPEPTSSPSNVDQTTKGDRPRRNHRKPVCMADYGVYRKNIHFLMEFLTEFNYPNPISERILSAPPVKEFKRIFLFIYNYINPNVKEKTIDKRPEEEIPKILKLIGYPFTISKSSMFSVGSPHTWPNLLGALCWLIELTRFAMKTSENINNVLFDDEEGYVDKLYFEYLENSYMSFMKGRELDDLKEHENTLFDKIRERNSAAYQEIEDLEGENAQLEQELAELEGPNILDNQELSPADVQRMKTEKKELARLLKDLENNRDHLDKNIWDMEMSYAKIHEETEKNIREYNETARKLKLVPATAENAHGFDFEMHFNPHQTGIAVYFQDTLKLSDLVNEKQEQVESLQYKQAGIDKDFELKKEEMAKEYKKAATELQEGETRLHNMKQQVQETSEKKQQQLQELQQKADKRLVELAQEVGEFKGFLMKACHLIMDHKAVMSDLGRLEP
ncbi:hypothetical protein QZH41_007422 [Actinostola sp. cb2023]|nr:hypothetical protein QZH41_007422 [Actinostola sp. cb2023]